MARWLNRRQVVWGWVLTVLVLAIAGRATAGQDDQCAVLPAAAQRAAAHLHTVQEPSGLFRYGFDFAARKALDGDNIVRQAGTAYALGEYYAHSRDPATYEVLVAALTALAARTIAVADGGLVSADSTPKGARTGATALAMLAELYLYRTSGDGRFARVRAIWKRGLRAMWLPGEGFRRTPRSRRTSDYFNGEIWLALAYLEATVEDPSLADWLGQVDRDLMARYRLEPTIGFYHWGVMAAAARFERTADPELRVFALRQTEVYLRVLRPRVHPTANTCYALEGLVTVRALAGDAADRALITVLDRRIAAEFAKNLALQVFPLSADRRDRRPEGFHAADQEREHGAFLAGSNRPFSRIDHTQHCLSAVVRADRFGISPEKWTPGYAAWSSVCSGVRNPSAEWRR
jgi:hypothetical protein